MALRVEVLLAHDPKFIPTVRALFEEYAASLGVTPCLDDFETELAELPWQYAPPRGRLLLARVKGAWAGTVGLRPIDATSCEVRRLYVRPAFRGLGLGRKLTVRLLDEARTIGYRRVRLETLPSMNEAQPLYESLGFTDVAGPDALPLDGIRLMEKGLRATR